MNNSVLFCSQTAYTGGGMEYWLEALANGLLARGHDVWLALARGIRFHDPERWLDRHPFPRDRVVVIDGRLGVREARVIAMWHVLRRVKADVVVPVGLADALYAAASWKRRRTCPRLIACLHGQDEARIMDVARCAPRIDIAVAVSRRVAGRLRSLAGLPAERVRHVPAGVESMPAAGARGQGGRPLAVAYVGRLDCAEKRSQDLITLAEALRGRNVRVLVAGDGPDGDALRSAAAERGLGNVLSWLGHVARADLPQRVYSRADAVITFSPAEGGPMSIWEGMLAGCVPIVSDYEGRAEENVIRNEETGLVFPVGDVASAAEATLRLQDEDLRRRLSDAVRCLPEAYRMQATLASWEGLLRDAASRSRVVEPWDEPNYRSPSRLTRWLPSIRAAATVRRWMRRGVLAGNPGDEWPSTYSGQG